MRPNEMKFRQTMPRHFWNDSTSSRGRVGASLDSGSSLTSLTWTIILAALLLVGCADDGSQSADTGGIGGTGVSQGTITAFGSIFVNGVEWEIDSAAIELDGLVATEADLRVGMRVRVVGDFSGDGSSGTATSVRFDDSVEGPISDVPVLTLPGGTEKSFTILGRTILVDESNTVFGDGASFSSLAMDQVLEVSGFDESSNTIRASRVSLRGVFPAVAAATLSGAVQNLMKNPDGSGIFEIGSITIRYLMTTQFEGLTLGDLAEGRIVDVEGDLRVSGNELDAGEIEAEDEGLGQEDAEAAEIEGVVSNFVSLADFDLDGVSVDASAAILEPVDLVVADGSFIEAEGRLVAGMIIADVLKSEEGEGDEIEIKAAITSLDIVQREFLMLGIVVFADGETEIHDERDGDESFLFSEMSVGDWFQIEGIEDGPARVRAKQIVRKPVGADVVLKGPVTALEPMMSTFSVLEQTIPLDMETTYFDAAEQPRTEEEFFRTPGDVNLGDRVVVTDENALSPDLLGVVDSVELD